MSIVDTIKKSVLENFGVKAKLLQVTPGPSVTRYEILPSTGVKLSKIVGLAEDLALNLAVPTVIDDHETDTWAHNVFKFHNIKGLMDVKSIELVEQGPLRASVRIKYTFGTSTLTQEFCLTEGKKVIRVKCKANWSEQFTMLKIPFNIGGTDAISTYEIPCGYIKRPCNGEEEPTQQWADITATIDGKRAGIAVINDGKYSYD